MGVAQSILDEPRRKQLDGIVAKMQANNESEDNIRFVVDDFKSKYSAQTPVEKKNQFGNVSNYGGNPFSPTKSQSKLESQEGKAPSGQTDYSQQQPQQYSDGNTLGYKVSDTKETTPLKPKPQEGDKLSMAQSMENSINNLGTSLKGVVPHLNLVTTNVFQKVFGKELTDKFNKLPRLNISSDGVDLVSGMTTEQIRNQALDKLDQLAAETKQTTGLVSSVKEGDVGGIAAGIVDSFTSLVATLVPTVASGGSLLVTEMMGQSMYDYNTAKAKSKGVSVKDLYKSGDADFGVPSIMGGLGYALERFGIKGMQKAINTRLALGEGYKKALVFGWNLNKEGFTELVQVGTDATNIALAQGESVEDAAKIGAKQMLSERGLEAYAKGVVGSGGAIGAGKLAQSMFSNENKNKATELELQNNQALQELADPNVSPEAKSAIVTVLENTAEKIDDLANQDRKIEEKLTEEQGVRIDEIKQNLAKLDAALGDPNISDITRQALLNDGAALENEFNNIVKAAEESKVGEIGTEEDVSKFVNRVAKGEKIESSEDLQFYENNKEEIEARLKSHVPQAEYIKVESDTRGEELFKAMDKSVERKGDDLKVYEKNKIKIINYTNPSTMKEGERSSLETVAKNFKKAHNTLAELINC